MLTNNKIQQFRPHSLYQTEIGIPQNIVILPS